MMEVSFGFVRVSSIREIVDILIDAWVFGGGGVMKRCSGGKLA